METVETEKVEKAGVVTLEKAIQSLLVSKRLCNLRPSYIKSLERYLRQFSKDRGDTPIDAFDVFVIESWLSNRKEALSTRASNVGRLSALFSFAERRGWIMRNPCRQLERIQLDQKPPSILTPVQVEGLLRFAQKNRPRALAFLSLSVFAGVRPQELERIDWNSYKDGKIVIDAAASKVRRRRVVDLHDTARSWVEASKFSPLPMSHKSRRRFLRQARRLLGLTSWPQDVLRHTAASFLMAIHKDAGLVADWLGNSPGILLTHYRQLVTAEEAAAFWAIKP